MRYELDILELGPRVAAHLRLGYAAKVQVHATWLWAGVGEGEGSGLSETDYVVNPQLPSDY